MGGWSGHFDFTPMGSGVAKLAATWKFENFKLFSAHLHPNLKSLANDRSQHLVKDHHACLYCLSNARPRHLQTHHQANLCVGQAIQSLKDIYYAVEKSCPVGSYIGGAYFFSKV